MVTEFYQRTCKDYNLNKIKNHYNYELKRSIVYMRLKDRTGVTIKDDTGEIVMPEEWWQERSEVWLKILFLLHIFYGFIVIWLNVIIIKNLKKFSLSNHAKNTIQLPNFFLHNFYSSNIKFHKFYPVINFTILRLLKCYHQNLKLNVLYQEKNLMFYVSTSLHWKWSSENSWQKNEGSSEKIN